MLPITTINDMLEAIAYHSQQAAIIGFNAREQIKAPAGTAWSIEYSIRQRLNGLAFQAEALISETARLAKWTRAIEAHNYGRYEEAV